MRDLSIESVCIFGSAARGSTDTLSDKDVLIVADDPKRRRQLEGKWAGEGWSVASYSPSRIRGMVRMGSLFIQHLKTEGIVVLDNCDWLANLLHSSEPKPNYKSDFQSALQLLKPLERLTSGYWQNLMAADLGFVFIRNAGIYTLADRGHYEFSYERIVKELAGDIELSRLEMDLLLRLRALKVAYRTRNRSPGNSFDLNTLLEVCSKVAGVHISQSISADAPIRLMPLRYATIRDVEARIIMKFTPPCLDQSMQTRELSSLWKMVTAPREYSWSIREIDSKWVATANRMLSQNSPKSPQTNDHAPNHLPLI